MVLDRTLLRQSPPKHCRLATAAAPSDAGIALNLDLEIFRSIFQLSILKAPICQPLQCRYCKEEFDRPEDRIEYLAIKHPDPLLCAEGNCAKQPTRVPDVDKYLPKHFRRHHTGIPYASTEEGYVALYVQQYSLSQHIRFEHTPGNMPQCFREGCTYPDWPTDFAHHQNLTYSFRSQEVLDSIRHVKCRLGGCKQ